jgi:hypothetical protein
MANDYPVKIVGKVCCLVLSDCVDGGEVHCLQLQARPQALQTTQVTCTVHNPLFPFILELSHYRIVFLSVVRATLGRIGCRMRLKERTINVPSFNNNNESKVDNAALQRNQRWDFYPY